MAKLEIIVTKEEQRAIALLKQLAKKWPKSLELFSWSGSLVILKEKNNRDAVIDQIIGISNDGGDPSCGPGQEVYYDNEIEIVYE